MEKFNHVADVETYAAAASKKIICCFILTVILAILGIWQVSLVFLILALFIGIYISFQIKNFVYRIPSIILVVLLSIFVVTGLSFARSFVLSHLYTPPAINSENLRVFNLCLQNVKKLDAFKSFIFRHGIFFIEDSFISPDDLLSEEKTRSFFSKNDILEITKLSQQLYNMKYVQFQRECDVVLFYKKANLIFPTRPGVVYSLTGDNPNEIDNVVINAAKPFVKIKGHWYISRKLVLRGPRSDIPTSIPKSLIDHSLRIDKLNLEERPDVEPMLQAKGKHRN